MSKTKWLRKPTRTVGVLYQFRIVKVDEASKEKIFAAKRFKWIPPPHTKNNIRYKLVLSKFSSQIFHFMTSKVVHDDRNGHLACDFFHCEEMISSLAKVVGLQSVEKCDPFFV